MQYIQIQPQNASQLPIPMEGSVNFFVDAINNRISTVDANGNQQIVSGLDTITKSDLDTLISNSGLTAGRFYKVTGVNPDLYGGTDIIIPKFLEQ